MLAELLMLLPPGEVVVPEPLDQMAQATLAVQVVRA
jgi:hypothetical protein